MVRQCVLIPGSVRLLPRSGCTVAAFEVADATATVTVVGPVGDPLGYVVGFEVGPAMIEPIRMSGRGREWIARNQAPRGPGKVKGLRMRQAGRNVRLG